MQICTSLFTFIFVLSMSAAFGQPALYTVANAHAHNDYRQQTPFFLAYGEQFGSIEADIHLYKGLLLVAHDSEELPHARTLENLYLQPLAAAVQKNGGHVYKDSSKHLQLLIDIKTDSIRTLNALITLLKKYPALISNKSICIVITGNRPAQNLYAGYPAFIWFDGNAGEQYSSAALTKIAMLSDDFSKYSKWKGNGVFPDSAKQQLGVLVQQAHQLNKPIRFWAAPDFTVAWQELAALKVDFLNTDHIAGLADFLNRHNDSLRLMPFNRIIHSAGEVIRFGNPGLENHALDATILSADGKLVIEDRYGIAALDAQDKKIIARWSFADMPQYKNYMSTYSGIRCFTEAGKTWIVWGASDKGAGKDAVMIAQWADRFINIAIIPIEKIAPATNALPNDITISNEGENIFLYVVLNGNNQMVKIKWADMSTVWTAATGVAPYGVAIAGNKIYVSNWAGATATDNKKERAGVPWGLAYTDPRTGATAAGTITVLDAATGKNLKDILVGLHPNAVKASGDGRFIYIANGSSDQVSVIDTKKDIVTETINVGLFKHLPGLQGSTPNALELSTDNTTLYVANGFDNAVAVIHLGKTTSQVAGYIPTEAYPGGLKLIQDQLVVTNLEADGANVIDAGRKARSIHNQLASVSIIPVPDNATLKKYTGEVAELNLLSRTYQLKLAPRPNAVPLPVPERLGEPSVFKHVVYIIKENKTYDQVFGDMPTGKNDSSLCIFGEKITPNMHALAKQYGWMDDYYASGKSSAEGHQWTDAGMVSDYVEKSVRAWFRSYPHRQADALVYNKSGFIWNQALDHGKKVRIYGEACETIYDKKLKWADIYKKYTAAVKPYWYNSTTIARIRPIISPTYPDCDNLAFSDQQRADIFMADWKRFEQGNNLPDLLVLSLPNDHTAGTSPDFPTPNAMVADNDLAVGRIVEMITKSKYWNSTVIFITQDDSQSGWDHISAYRTVGLTISPYSSGKLVSSNYNQTSMLRTIEQILGVPPMNIMDASARLMTDCFQMNILQPVYKCLPNNIPINQMNMPLHALKGKAKKYALQSLHEVFNEVDGGEDDTMNRIIWFYAKGNAKYPGSNGK